MAVPEQFAVWGQRVLQVQLLGWDGEEKAKGMSGVDCTDCGRNAMRSSEGGNSQPPTGRCVRGASC